MKIAKSFAYLLLFVFISFTTVSCFNTDDNASFATYGFAPATSITYNQDSIQPVGKPMKFVVEFTLTGDCQKFIEFRRLNSLPTDNTTDVGAFISQENNVNCTTTVQTVKKSFNISTLKAGGNTVRAWAGKDETGQDIYVSTTINIPTENTELPAN